MQYAVCSTNIQPTSFQLYRALEAKTTEKEVEVESVTAAVRQSVLLMSVEAETKVGS